MSAKKKTDVLLNRALSLAKEKVQRLAYDPTSAQRACQAGLVYLEKRAKQLELDYPGFDLKELRTLPALCQRVGAAQRELGKIRFTRNVGSRESIVNSLSWRRKLMPIAESLAAAGKVDSQEVARIRAGLGHHDSVRDVIDLIVVLSPHEAAVTAVLGEGVLEVAGTTANEALDALGVGPNDPEIAEMAADLRDRYATLVIDGHDRLKAAVAALAGYREADQRVAPLGTHGSSRAVTADEPVPSPTS